MLVSTSVFPMYVLFTLIFRASQAMLLFLRFTCNSVLHLCFVSVLHTGFLVSSFSLLTTRCAFVSSYQASELRRVALICKCSELNSKERPCGQNGGYASVSLFSSNSPSSFPPSEKIAMRKQLDICRLLERRFYLKHECCSGKQDIKMVYGILQRGCQRHEWKHSTLKKIYHRYLAFLFEQKKCVQLDPRIGKQNADRISLFPEGIKIHWSDVWSQVRTGDL